MPSSKLIAVIYLLAQTIEHIHHFKIISVCILSSFTICAMFDDLLQKLVNNEHRLIKTYICSIILFLFISSTFL